MGKQPAFMTPRGVVRCAFCRTDDYGLPPPVRQGEHHTSVRFGDHAGASARNQLWTVLLDGEDVTKLCFEALAGPSGVVYLHDLNSLGNRYLCPTGPKGSSGHAVIVKYTGRVSVSRRATRQEAPEALT
jgi:hypothetical protein